MTRKTKLMLNTGTGILKQVTVLICGFILPKAILEHFGSDTNGLISSITQFLSFISLLEVGMGPVVQSNLYAPLAKKDHEQISRIFASTQRFFRRIAYIFIAYLAALAVLFPMVIQPEAEPFFTVSLLLIISVSTFAEYFFGATYSLLLSADQKSYVGLGTQIVTTILNTVLCISLMNMGASIQTVKLVSSAIFVLRPFALILYVNRHYKINKKIRYKGEPIKQKWNGFAQHLASVISGNIDYVTLSLFSTLQNVSIYSVYHMVVNGITNLIITASSGLDSFFASILISDNRKKLNDTFGIIEWITHFIVTIVFTITALTIVPFVSVYTAGLEDAAAYIAPVFSMFIVLSFGTRCLRLPYFSIIRAAGHYKQTQIGSFITAGINLVVSIVLVFRFGLSGIAVGTLMSFVFHTTYCAWYLKNNILCRPLRHYLLHVAVDILIGVSAYFLTQRITMESISYLSWIFMAVKKGCITLLIGFVINFVIYRKALISSAKMLFSRKKSNN